MNVCVKYVEVIENGVSKLVCEWQPWQYIIAGGVCIALAYAFGRLAYDLWKERRK